MRGRGMVIYIVQLYVNYIAEINKKSDQNTALCVRKIIHYFSDCFFYFLVQYSHTQPCLHTLSACIYGYKATVKCKYILAYKYMFNHLHTYLYTYIYTYIHICVYPCTFHPNSKGLYFYESLECL